MKKRYEIFDGVMCWWVRADNLLDVWQRITTAQPSPVQSNCIIEGKVLTATVKKNGEFRTYTIKEYERSTQ